MSDALEKINSQIQFALSHLILEQYPDAMLSITNVETSRDLEHSRILVSILGDNKGTLEKLNRDSKYFRKKIARSQNLRRTPELAFYLDESDKNYENISKLLNNQK